ncbi:hypothetical protein U1Q18_035255 [Sarracenia purpurea var. burkii]
MEIFGAFFFDKIRDRRFANRRPKDLSGLFVKSRKIREETLGEKSTRRERNCLIPNSGVFRSVLSGVGAGASAAREASRREKTTLKVSGERVSSEMEITVYVEPLIIF